MNAKELRKQVKKHAYKEPCVVCEKHAGITHLHHVLSLKECAYLLNVRESIDVPVVWLCPNCHAYVHQMQRGIFYNALRELSEDEYLRICSIIEQRDKAMGTILKEATI